ncbi:MAG: B12-binding domain-containing radical SAM protein [Phycisphaerae bacterium]|nr:B12-binding domain-containing radical SAM protein [Phycisphaerae bacterium]
MTAITLIRPPTVATANSYSVPITPPLGLAYVAASLEAAGHQVTIIDAVGEAPLHREATCHPRLVAHGLSIEDIVRRVDPCTRGIGVSAMFSQEWPHTEQLILALHRRLPQVPIFLGGEHATAAWDYVLGTCPAVSFCVLGEGEQTAIEVAEHLADQRSLSSVAGVACRDARGTPMRTAERPRVRQPSTLPRPAWHLVPLPAYLDGGFGHGVDRGRSMPILATRGCPYQCAFCSSPTMWTTRYFLRDVTNVVDEIEEYVRRYHVTNIDFYDLTAIVKRRWILAFCAELERRALNITWQLPSGTRTEALDREVLGALYRTGCRNITYAPESGSPATLERIRKRISLAGIVRSIRDAKRVGISLKCNLIIGFPDETRRDAWRTVLLAWRLACLGADDVPLYLFSPYPGSSLFAELRRRGVIGRLDNDYFASLGCFMDLTTGSGYCRAVGPRELNFYRFIGMAGAYLLGYLSRPWRILRTIRNVCTGRSQTVIEQRLCDALKRRLAPPAAEPEPVPQPCTPAV